MIRPTPSTTRTDTLFPESALVRSVAVSAPNGLVVPVIRDAQDMSVAQVERTIGDFGKRAKEGALTMEEMKGGTFTISNGGVFGSLMSMPIIRSEEHTSELQSLMRNSYAVFCLNKKTHNKS